MTRGISVSTHRGPFSSFAGVNLQAWTADLTALLKRRLVELGRGRGVVRGEGWNCPDDESHGARLCRQEHLRELLVSGIDQDLSDGATPVEAANLDAVTNLFSNAGSPDDVLRYLTGIPHTHGEIYRRTINRISPIINTVSDQILTIS
jgi:hypothetical protein